MKDDFQVAYEKAVAYRDEPPRPQATAEEAYRHDAEQRLAKMTAVATAKPRTVHPGRRISNKQLVQIASNGEMDLCGGEIDETLPKDGSVVLSLYNDSARAKFIRNALDPHNPNGGGYLVPSYTVLDALEIALQTESAMRRRCSVIRRDTTELRVPETNDTTNEGALVAPNSTAASQDILFTARAMGDYKFSSTMLKVPYELLRDSEVFAQSVGKIVGMRLARIGNRLFTVGNGAGQPQGLVGAAKLGITAGSPTVFSVDDLLGLVAGIPGDYKELPTTGWMMSSQTWLLAQKLKDASSRYLWAEAGLDRWPIFYNDHMVSPSAGTRPVLFGDFSRFLIRDIGGVRISFLNEPFAEFDQIGVVGFQNTDCVLLDAGTGPIQALQMAAS